MKPLIQRQKERYELSYDYCKECQLVQQKSTDLEWILNIYCEKTSPFYVKPFQLKVILKENYPQEPPLLKICQPNLFYHPNINQKGDICHANVTKKSPQIKIIDRIIALIGLLQCPNPDGAFPIKKEAAEIFRKDPNQWYYRALLTYQGLKY